MTMQPYLRLILLWMLGSTTLSAQRPAEWSARLAHTLMTAHPDSFSYDKSKPSRWDYELGLYLKSLESLWRHTGNGDYFRYIRRQLDFYVQPDGHIRTYDPEEYNIDHITPGRAALLLWEQTRQEKYRLAAQALRGQLKGHPRTKEGGFWHKKRYPWQMWLDGLYMAQPFWAEYSLLLNEPENFDDIANQFVWMEKHARDPKTGLLYHAWDESRQQRWADKKTGQSPHFWGRAMGWYMMALVDALDYFPENHPRRAALVAIFQRTAAALAKVQEPKTGLWFQVLDKAAEPGNYLEASASSMFTYAFAKGARLGYLDARFAEIAQRAYAGILREFVSQDSAGAWHLNRVCSVAGLGGDPYRDGSFGYYISEPVRSDDLKGAAPFILAGVELERLTAPKPAKGKTVLLDRFFNNEYRDGARFHYTWEDRSDAGYSWWGQMFRDFGAQTASLDVAPTAENLRQADVYILVDPDTQKETANPNFVEEEHIVVLKNWVQNGGTLVLFANDTANCETKKFNRLAETFGIRFSDRSRNMVKNNQYEQGAVRIPPGHSLFRNASTLFIKEISILELQPPAEALLADGADVVMATARFGKGRVLALGDPWLYNEYVDGKRLPAGFDNFDAARDLANWLLTLSSSPVSPEAAEVEQAVEKLRQALLSGDRRALEAIADEQLTYGHSSGKVENKAAFVETLASGKSRFTALHFSDRQVTLSGNTAVVRHALSATTHDAGKPPGTVQLAVLLVWTKQNGDWKLLARQALKF